MFLEKLKEFLDKFFSIVPAHRLLQLYFFHRSWFKKCFNYSLATSWNKTSTFSFESEIIITCGVSVVVEVVVFLRKLKDVSKSSSNSLLFCFYSKILTSSTMNACQLSGSTKIALVNLTCFAISFSTCSLLKAWAFLLSSFSLASCFNFFKALSFLAFDSMKK